MTNELISSIMANDVITIRAMTDIIILEDLITTRMNGHLVGMINIISKRMVTLRQVQSWASKMYDEDFRLQWSSIQSWSSNRRPPWRSPHPQPPRSPPRPNPLLKLPRSPVPRSTIVNQSNRPNTRWSQIWESMDVGGAMVTYTKIRISFTSGERSTIFEIERTQLHHNMFGSIRNIKSNVCYFRCWYWRMWFTKGSRRIPYSYSFSTHRWRKISWEESSHLNFFNGFFIIVIS